ncbi:MAG: LemA family protein [Novosphingobium sp.]
MRDILLNLWLSSAIVIAVVIVFLLITIYNRLVSLRQNCNQGVADIDAQLRQRHDLIPNLVAAVKGYAAHEKATFDAVITARNRAEAGRGGDAAAESALGGALGKLFALAEAYPDLKASTGFQTLQGELADVEDKLAAARRAQNAAAATYNAARESFPAVLFAGMLGFSAYDFQRIGDGEGAVRDAPVVAF